VRHRRLWGRRGRFPRRFRSAGRARRQRDRSRRGVPGHVPHDPNPRPQRLQTPGRPPQARRALRRGARSARGAACASRKLGTTRPSGRDRARDRGGQGRRPLQPRSRAHLARHEGPIRGKAPASTSRIARARCHERPGRHPPGDHRGGWVGLLRGSHRPRHRGTRRGTRRDLETRGHGLVPRRGRGTHRDRDPGRAARHSSALVGRALRAPGGRASRSPRTRREARRIRRRADLPRWLRGRQGDLGGATHHPGRSPFHEPRSPVAPGGTTAGTIVVGKVQGQFFWGLGDWSPPTRSGAPRISRRPTPRGTWSPGPRRTAADLAPA
jgi:hypothetical protein